MIHGLVQCAVCGQMWNPLDPGIAYRSLDLRWMCADEGPCHGRAIERTTELDRRRMQRGLDKAWDAIDAVIKKAQQEGWRI